MTSRPARCRADVSPVDSDVMGGPAELGGTESSTSAEMHAPTNVVLQDVALRDLHVWRLGVRHEHGHFVEFRHLVLPDPVWTSGEVPANFSNALILPTRCISSGAPSRFAAWVRYRRRCAPLHCATR